MKLSIRLKVVANVVLLSAILVSCVTQLAPTYDSQLVLGVNDLNRKSLTYFASMSPEFASKKFEDSEDTYNELIGLTQSLIAQSETRPVPDNKAIKKINEMLAKKGKPVWDPNNNLPSTVALQGILEEFQKLKAWHADGSLNKTKFELRKSSVSLYLDQAMTFEYALER